MKYHAKKTGLDGLTFDSQKEARRYAELKLLERAGQIHSLRRQVKYELIPAQKIHGRTVERACSYMADFVYEENGQTKIQKRKNIWGEYMDAVVCSECGGISQYGLKTAYCSRCGAKMDGEENEDEIDRR